VRSFPALIYLDDKEYPARHITINNRRLGKDGWIDTLNANILDGECEFLCWRSKAFDGILWYTIQRIYPDDEYASQGVRERGNPLIGETASI
jgi:hypothetical protein